MLFWSAALTWAMATAQQASSLYNNEHTAVERDTVPPNNFFYVHGSSLRVASNLVTATASTPIDNFNAPNAYDYRLLINNGESPDLSMLRGERYRFLVAENAGEVLEQRSNMRHFGFHMWTAGRNANGVATCDNRAPGSNNGLPLRSNPQGGTLAAYQINVKPAAALAGLPDTTAAAAVDATFGPHVLECNELAWRADVGFAIGSLTVDFIGGGDDAILRAFSANGFSIGDLVHVQQPTGGLTTAVVSGRVTINAGSHQGTTTANQHNLVLRRISGTAFPGVFIQNVRVFKSNRGDNFNPVVDTRSSNPLLLEFSLHNQDFNGGPSVATAGLANPTNTRAPFQDLLCYNRRGFTATRRPFDQEQVPSEVGLLPNADPFGGAPSDEYPWVSTRNDLFPYGAPFERTGWQEVTLALPVGTTAATGGLALDTDLCYGMCNLYETTQWPNPTSLLTAEAGYPIPAAGAVSCFGVGHISVVDRDDNGPAVVRTLTIRGSTVQLHPAIVTQVDPNDPSGDVYGDHTVQPALPRNQVALPYVYQPISTVIPVDMPAAGAGTTNGDVSVTLSGQNLDTTEAEFRLYPCNPVLPPCPNGARDKGECQEGRPANRNPSNFGDRWLNGYPSIPKATAGRDYGAPNVAAALNSYFDTSINSLGPLASSARTVDTNDAFKPFDACFGASGTSPWNRCDGAPNNPNEFYQWNNAPKAAWPAFDAQLASTVCTCETARSQAPILWRNGDDRIVTSGRIPAGADRTETSATLTLPGSLLDNALTMNGARAIGREGDFILCPTVPFVDSRAGAVTVTPGGQGLILQLRRSCASDAACQGRSETTDCENAFDRNECRLATQCRDVGGSSAVCVVPETQDVCGTNLYNKVEGRCCDPANSLVYPADVWAVSEDLPFGGQDPNTLPLINTDFFLSSLNNLNNPPGTPANTDFANTICALNAFAADGTGQVEAHATRSLLEYQMCTFVDSLVTKGYDTLGLNAKVMAARWRKQVQQMQGRPRFPCPCTAANYPGDGGSEQSFLGAQTYGCALQNEQCCTFNSAGWRNDAAATLEANPLFLSLDYYQCFDTQYFGCCDDGQVYNSGLERCCALTGIQPAEVPCPCAADADCMIPNRADKDADMFCCSQSAPRPAFYDESVATCSRFQNWEPVEDYFGLVGAGIKHHAHPTVEKLRRAEENSLYAGSAQESFDSASYSVSSRFGKFGRSHAVATCPGVCIDTSYQTCCNGNVCGSEYETCCNSTCCNKFSATCVESRNAPKAHSSWMERFLFKDTEFGVQFSDNDNDDNNWGIIGRPENNDGIRRAFFRFEAFQPFRGFLGNLYSGAHPAWFASSVNYGNTYDVCTTVEFLNPIRAFMVFVLPTFLLLLSIGMLTFAFVFALRQADRSYFLTEKILVVLAVSEALFAWPLFFSPQFKYGIFVMLAAVATIMAAGARIKYTHVVMAVAQTVLVLYLLDPFAGSDFFTLASWKDAVTPNADFRANGLHRHITTNWLVDVSVRGGIDVNPFPDTGAPVLDQQFNAHSNGGRGGGPPPQGVPRPNLFVDDAGNENLAVKASAGQARGLPAAYKFDHVAANGAGFVGNSAYAFGSICTAFYSGYFQYDTRLLDTERYDNFQERFFGYCSRGWTATLLILSGFVVMLAILVLLFTLFEIGILIQWQRDGEWNFDPEEADMFRARDKIADLGPEDVPAYE